MKHIILALLLTASMGATAQSWTSLALEGNATKPGAVYAAVCNACLGGSYSNDTGYWACTDAPQDGQTPCWDALKQAAMDKYTGCLLYTSPSPRD